eukprot:212906-Hanusia_phi.AAC.1
MLSCGQLRIQVFEVSLPAIRRCHNVELYEATMVRERFQTVCWDRRGVSASRAHVRKSRNAAALSWLIPQPCSHARCWKL